MWPTSAIEIWIHQVEYFAAQASPSSPPTPPLPPHCALPPTPPPDHDSHCRKRKVETDKSEPQIATYHKRARMAERRADDPDVDDGVFTEAGAETSNTPRASLQRQYPLQLTHAMGDNLRSPEVSPTRRSQATTRDASSHASSNASSRAESSSQTSSSRRVKRKLSPSATASARTTSPSKKIVDREHAQNPLRSGHISNVDELPLELRELVAQMGMIADGENILSGALRENLRKDVSTGMPWKDARVFADGEEREKRDALGTAPDLEDIKEIVDDARRDSCKPTTCTTTAAVLPHLLQKQPLNDIDKLESKKVDFCLALELPDVDRTVQLLHKQNLYPFNPTDYGGIRDKPIAISIETKPSEGNLVEAENQLHVWCQAHFAFLRHAALRAAGTAERNNDNISLPCLPVLLVKGHDWYCHFIEYRNPTEDQPASTFFWRMPVSFGGTTDALRTYQVIAGMQVLIYWADVRLRSWLREMVFEPLERMSG
ncbi:Hypothetical predicted protein [Lecanosticta acicola]|uniref:PD-(D/E)XK nuclease-like domain-containing protein n=1 Tax=Lecanosticta acicola TaxID=111012 RepID=A0AAI8YYJ1_9PEZI|nr:Hypothetical predicted protein [Lecanosticta acicola]